MLIAMFWFFAVAIASPVPSTALRFAASGSRGVIIVKQSLLGFSRVSGQSGVNDPSHQITAKGRRARYVFFGRSTSAILDTTGTYMFPRCLGEPL